MITIKWLPEAQEDLQRLHEYLSSYSKKAAAKAINKLIEATSSLKEFPEKGRPWHIDMDFRELFVTFGARGYVVRYRIVQDKIIIVRVWHALENRLT